MTVSAYPLHWPMGRSRARYRGRAMFGTSGRGNGKQSLTVAEARERLSEQVEILNARYVTLSTNLELRLDGAPRSGQPEPSDPGAAIYFHSDRTGPLTSLCVLRFLSSTVEPSLACRCSPQTH